MTSDPDPAELRSIIRDEINTMLLKHLQLCPFASMQIEPRVRKLENRFATLIGIALGSGTFGGVLGTALAKLIT